MIDQFRNWLDYERDSGLRAIEMIESVPAEQRSLPQFQTALNKLAHTLVARKMWLHRLGHLEKPSEKMFPTNTTAAQLREWLPEVYSVWSDWLAGQDDSGLGKEIEYQSSEGDCYVNCLEEILIQLHGHALYHRGQIATLVTQCGGRAVDTDYIYVSRRAVSQT